MSASSSPPPPPHRIAILMSREGRFLQCMDCQLIHPFPDGIKFGVVAKQFEAHSCVTPTRTPAWHTDRRFVILRYEGKVPSMASCAKCARKFFTPTALMRDASGAEMYLGRKFDLHQCGPNPQLVGDAV
jgi:hypothetical protein